MPVGTYRVQSPGFPKIVCLYLYFGLYSVQSDVEKYVSVNVGMFAMPFVESRVQFQMLSGRLWRAGSSSKYYLAVCGELGPVPNAIWPLGTVQHAIHSVSHTFLQCYLWISCTVGLTVNSPFSVGGRTYLSPILTENSPFSVGGQTHLSPILTENSPFSVGGQTYLFPILTEIALFQSVDRHTFPQFWQKTALSLSVDRHTFPQFWLKIALSLLVDRHTFPQFWLKIALSLSVDTHAFPKSRFFSTIKTVKIVIMYIYHVLIDSLRSHVIHINLNTIFYIRVERTRSY